MPPSLSGTVLKKKWELGALVGHGGCAEVYEATDVRAPAGVKEKLVAKIAPLPVGLPPAMSKGKKRKKTDQEKHADMIYYEYTLYKGFLLGHDGVVQRCQTRRFMELDRSEKVIKLHATIPAGGYGEDKNLRYLVMTRLGPDIEAAQRQSGPWSPRRTAGYARMMLGLLRSLHEKCKMVFVDVKPENFMFGYPGSADEEKIFLIDFGLAFRYTGREGAVKPQSQSAQVQGTPEFLSLKCHAGASPGRCDDLESLGYVILSILRGGPAPLPWSGSTSVANGLATKKSTSLEALCQDCPPSMLGYMKTVRAMEYEQTPDYDGLDVMLEGIGKGGGAASGGAAGGSREHTHEPAPKKKGAASGRSTGARAKASTKHEHGKRKLRQEDVEEEEEADVCEMAGSRAKRSGAAPAIAGRSAAAAPTAVTSASTAAASTRRSKRLMATPEKPKNMRSTWVTPEREREGKQGRQADDADSSDFVDARSEESKGDEPEVVEIVAAKGGARDVAGRKRRSARDTASSARERSKKTGSASTAGFTLEVTNGPHKGLSLRLVPGGHEVRVGRDAPRRSGLRLDKDMEVSGSHAVIRPEGDGIIVEDVGSLNGSYVNEDKTEGATKLRDGDTLQLGQSIMKISVA